MRVRKSHLLTAGLIQLMAHEHAASSCEEASSPRLPKLLFFTPATKETLVQGVFTYSLYC